jgi:hypothetical protein
MTWKYAWRYRWKVFTETVTTANFWWTTLGILGALVVWFYLFYLAIKHLDTSLAMHSTFCSSDEQRNNHILAIVLTTPLFLVGLIGVIGEWMTIMDNRRAGRKNKYKAIIVFSIMMQVTALIILFALKC